jgi:hypothetical protein
MKTVSSIAGHMVAQLVETLPYVPEGRGLEFVADIIPAALWYSAPKRYE